MVGTVPIILDRGSLLRFGVNAPRCPSANTDILAAYSTISAATAMDAITSLHDRLDEDPLP